MIRTIAAVIVLLGAILWSPVWVQLILFACAIVLVRYRAVLLIPAIVSDVLYAPTPSLAHMKCTLVVAAMIGVWYLLMTQTRLGESALAYVSIKKK
jgi:hypothetical protein